MPTFLQIYYHIVLATKGRCPVLLPEGRERLFRFIWGIIKNRNCHLYRINGMEDHIHMVTALHPKICLANLMRDVKAGLSKWIKEERLFPDFTAWQDGYGAFTHSRADKDRLIGYVKDQQEHHKRLSFEEEWRRLLAEAGMELDERSEL